MKAFLYLTASVHLSLMLLSYHLKLPFYPGPCMLLAARGWLSLGLDSHTS